MNPKYPRTIISRMGHAIKWFFKRVDYWNNTKNMCKNLL